MADQLRTGGVTIPRVEDPSVRQSAMVVKAQTEKFVEMTSSYVLKQEKKTQLERSLFDLKSQRLRNPASSLIFSRNGGVDSLLQLSRNLQKNDEGDCSLLGLVWGTLANLCAFDEETRRKVLTAISEICEILANCPYPKVVNTTCRTLGNLTSSTRFTQSCQGNEIIMIREITRILISIQDSGCLQSTLRALRKLCSNGILNEELRLTQSFAAVATTLSLNDTSVTIAALRTFETLTSSHGDCDLIPDLWLVSDNTPLRLLVQLVSQSNIGCPSVDMAIALLGRCVRHVDGKAALSRAGGIEVMVNILMQETDRKFSGIHAEILDILCLCCRDVHGRQKMRDSSGLQLLIKFLHDDEFKGCHEDLLSALICYYFDEHTLRYMVSQLGLMKSLTHHLMITTKGLKEERSSGNDWPRGQGDMDDGDGPGSVVSSFDDRRDFEVSLSAVDSDVDQSSLLSFATECSVPGSPSAVGTGIECSSRTSLDNEPRGICSPVFNPDGFVDIGTSDGYNPVKTGIQVSTPLFLEDNLVQSSSSQHTPSTRHRIVAIDEDQLTPVPVNFIDSILSSPMCSPAISPLPQSSIHLLSDTQNSLESKLLLLISRLSHLHVCQPILATPENLSVILEYFLTFDGSNCTQTFKILSRLFGNPLCFQDCLKTHASSLIFKHMCCTTIPTSTTSLSDQQTYSLQVMCTELFDKLSHVASSPYGQGVVAHMLLRGNEKEVVAGTLALSLLQKSRVVCHKMLINYNGLHNLFHLVQGQSLSEHSPAFDDKMSESVSNNATMTLLLLANTYYTHPINKRRRSSAFPSEESDHLFSVLPTKKARLETQADSIPITDMLSSFPSSSSFTNKSDYMCRYIDTDNCPFDLILVIGDEERSCRFPVHRHRFVEVSEVFAVMLVGLYQESQLGTICIREVNPSVFKSYVHHVYGCQWPCEVEREEWRKELLKSDEMEIDSGNGLNYDLLKELIESVTLPCIRIQELVHYLLLLECANRYYLPSLISRCEDVLAPYVTSANLVSMFMYASIHQGHRLCRECVIVLVSLGDVEKQCVVMRELLSSSDDALSCLDIIKDFFHVH